MKNQKIAHIVARTIPAALAAPTRFAVAGSIALILAGNPAAAEPPSKPLAQTPPMGWNSFDSYRVDIHEQACFENLKTFVDVFKPAGYEYFVIDAGWYYEFNLRPGTLIPVAGKYRVIDQNLDEHGYLIPSKCFFPNGFKPLADECHKHGVKFGVHIMRGIPRKAVKLNTPVKGTSHFAREIADTASICEWCSTNYGVDMTKPGAQEYYDGFIRQLADYGVDFIKADDIVEFPAEIEAVIKAIRKTGRPITLSLSPGDRVLGNEMAAYEKADMLRVTGDVWDRQFDIDKCFDSWLTGQRGAEKNSGWIAVFNRSGEKKTAQVSLKGFGLDPEKSYDFHDVWGDKPFKPGKVELEPHDCVFLRYHIQNQ